MYIICIREALVLPLIHVTLGFRLIFLVVSCSQSFIVLSRLSFLVRVFVLFPTYPFLPLQSLSRYAYVRTCSALKDNGNIYSKYTIHSIYFRFFFSFFFIAVHCCSMPVVGLLFSWSVAFCIIMAVFQMFGFWF